MAQKSLPQLSKVGVSMIWFTTYYYKHYKWLSSQTLYLLIFFNKLFVYLDFFFSRLLWINNFNLVYRSNVKKFSKKKFFKIRYFKPVTAYLVLIGKNYFLINLYYKSTLESFQNNNLPLNSKTINTPYSKIFKQSKLFYNLR